MPKAVNRPRDEFSAPMQQGQPDLAENEEGAQMGDSAVPEDTSEQQPQA